MSARTTARRSGCPNSGPIGANGLANPRDFLHAGRRVRRPRRALSSWSPSSTATSGRPISTIRRSTSSPGTATTRRTYTICARFNAIGTVSFDHPDPSIFTVLTSPTDTPGTANCDFVIFPPRWMVAEHTFRPPCFHRNYMSEFMGLVHGAYDAKAEGFVPGGASLHNCMSAHGPDRGHLRPGRRRRLSRRRSTTRWPSCSRRGSSSARRASRSKPLPCSAITTSAGPGSKIISGAELGVPIIQIASRSLSRGQVRGSDRDAGQALCRGLLSLAMALRMVSSFRARAMRPTMFGFPACSGR